MNKDQPANFPWTVMEFPSGFEVSWAGANPLGDGYCYGSEDGGIQFFDKSFSPLGQAIKTSASGEAINVVVGRGAWFATATRGEINLIGRSSTGKSEMHHLPFGAHDMAVTSSGYFVAALGRLGLMFAAADIAKQDFTIMNPDAAEIFAYSVMTFPGDKEHDVIVCAGRNAGILVGRWQAPQATTKMRTMSFSGFDVIDICSIGTPEHPHAVAGLDKNGSLVLAKDILSDGKPGTLKFDSVTGNAFRIVRCRSHLFVLTSDGLFGLWNLAENFVNNKLAGNFETSIWALPMEAIDLNLVMDHWLLIVGTDSVIRIDIDAIQENSAASGMGKDRPRILTPAWTNFGVVQTTKEFALTA